MSLEIVDQWSATIEELTNLHKDVIQCLISGFEKAVLSGEKLTIVKGALKHGEWLPWIANRLPYSQRTAWEYMAAFEQQDSIRPKLEAASNLNWRTLTSSGSNGNGKTPQLHESSFYFHSIRLSSKLMLEINHELKDHPIETWDRGKCQSLAAALEPAAELYQRLKLQIA